MEEKSHQQRRWRRLKIPDGVKIVGSITGCVITALYVHSKYQTYLLEQPQDFAQEKKEEQSNRCPLGIYHDVSGLARHISCTFPLFLLKSKNNICDFVTTHPFKTPDPKSPARDAQGSKEA
jgi:hypothetical protein